MTDPRIQLLVFDGCPLAGAARRSLEQALADLDLGGYEEIDLMAESAGALRGWGSPTILIDGRDLIGGTKGAGVGCRVYSGPGGVPMAAEIASAIVAARDRERR